MRIISEHRCFDGVQGYYAHDSLVCASEMRFSVFRPPQASPGHNVPVLFYLAGLTCTEETFAIKAGAQRVAAELGIMLVSPDTSPRGLNLPGDSQNWDFGVGAGFYVDATQAPWSDNYKMYSYVVHELPSVILHHFPVSDRRGIFGHSMGGHGALVCALRNPKLYRSVSAFAPICAPTQCPWGEKAFTGYLGADREAWKQYDATELVPEQQLDTTILVDQGTADQFLPTQLHPELLEAACAESGQSLNLRRHEGYDHGYFFISTFMEDHLRHHAAELNR